MAILGAMCPIPETRRVARLAAVILCAAFSTASPVGQFSDEYHVKAAFLYNFARFVEWPGATFRTQHDPLVICVLGADPFGSALDETLAGKQLDGRALQIVRIPDASQANACQIVFISSSERKKIGAILAALPAAGVLTVGEMDSFATAGGIINFTLNKGRVSFQVNPRAAEKAGLQISSRLLSLAQIVDR